MVIQHTIGFLFLTLMVTTDCTGFEPALLYSSEELKQRALTARPRSHFSNRNKEKYLDRRSNNVTTDQKHMNEPQNSILYLQLKFDEIQNDYLTKTRIFSWC